MEKPIRSKQELDDLPDWLKDVGVPDSADSIVPSEPESELKPELGSSKEEIEIDELPEWLRNAVPVSGETSLKGSQDIPSDAPAWMTIEVKKGDLSPLELEELAKRRSAAKIITGEYQKIANQAEEAAVRRNIEATALREAEAKLQREEKAEMLRQKELLAIHQDEKRRAHYEEDLKRVQRINDAMARVLTKDKYGVERGYDQLSDSEKKGVEIAVNEAQKNVDATLLKTYAVATGHTENPGRINIKKLIARVKH